MTQLLFCPGHGVQLAASWTLRTFALACPTILSLLIQSFTEYLEKEKNNIEEKSIKSYNGHGHALAAMICVIPNRPLYVSHDLTSKIYMLASELLNSSTRMAPTAQKSFTYSHATIFSQIGWRLYTSLMCLGANNIKFHLPALLAHWKIALCKKPVETQSQSRPDLELIYQVTRREAALTAMYR